MLWFGDSHAAADYWPNVLRQALQERFGNGGPGYIYFGLDVYRHAGVTLKHAGRWRRAPRSPSLWTRQDDGIFGLGGIRTSPADGATLTVELAAPKARAKARWELVYRLRSASASFRAGWGAESRRIDGRSAQPANNGVARFSFETEPTATVTLDSAVGEPELFGAVIESTEPGVVVDTLGINGARIGTPLAWDESAWIAEVRARRPDLVVLAYGTNEVGDAVAPSRYGGQYDAFIARIRQAAPAVDCFIIGPTDRAEPDWTTHPRVLEVEAVEKQAAERLGCGFQSAVAAMGGPNSLKRWADAAPALATPDRIHLTPKGYERLGAMTAEAILAGLQGEGASRCGACLLVSQTVLSACRLSGQRTCHITERRADQGGSRSSVASS